MATKIPARFCSEGARKAGPRGKTPRGKTPRGKNPRGKTPRGKTPRGKTPRGKTPRGKTPRGNEALTCIVIFWLFGFDTALAGVGRFGDSGMGVRVPWGGTPGGGWDRGPHETAHDTRDLGGHVAVGFRAVFGGQNDRGITAARNQPQVAWRDRGVADVFGASVREKHLPLSVIHDPCILYSVHVLYSNIQRQLVCRSPDLNRTRKQPTREVQLPISIPA